MTLLCSAISINSWTSILWLAMQLLPELRSCYMQ